MQGTRLYAEPGEPDFPLRISETPGAYGKFIPLQKTHWFCTTPNGLFGNISAHNVEEHEDGTITVTPSIMVTGGESGESYHGYLERGVWRDA